jgi:phosphopantothenoylcysteine decarboxylase/phosphopantothenate--cysteine ligase
MKEVFELNNKNIILGVTGSIAAYKAVYLTRLLVASGANVKVIMTDWSKHFVSELTFSALSKNKVHSSLVSDGQWNSHIELAQWADLIVVAPATANTIAKFAHGFCDNLLSAVFLSAKSPIIIAPAMDVDMYENKVTQENIQKLQKRGIKVLETGEGELASGLIGKGRMLESEKIFRSIRSVFTQKSILKDKKVIVTAGPTRESVDPVRFITNATSGKTGFRLAEAFHAFGAQVTLITGPTSEIIQRDGIEVIQIQSAEEMFNEVKKLYPKSHIALFSAAVSDFTPVSYSPKKIKKESKQNEFLELARTKDIAFEMGKLKTKGQINIGFALEDSMDTKSVEEKKNKKNFDLMILNSFNTKNFEFGSETSNIKLIEKKGSSDLMQIAKNELGIFIVKKVIELLENNNKK